MCTSSPDEPAEYKNRGDLESDVGIRKACRFSRALLGPCSGLTDREFGFKEGKPCLIVKLNRIVNFYPRVINHYSIYHVFSSWFGFFSHITTSRNQNHKNGYMLAYVSLQGL